MALFQALGDPPGKARALTTLGIIAGRQADYASARRYHEESLSLYGELSQSLGAAYALDNPSLARATEGDDAGGVQPSRRALPSSAGRATSGAWGSPSRTSETGCTGGASPKPRAALEESLAVKREIGETRGLVVLLEGFASLRTSLRGACGLTSPSPTSARTPRGAWSSSGRHSAVRPLRRPGRRGGPGALQALDLARGRTTPLR